MRCVFFTLVVICFGCGVESTMTTVEQPSAIETTLDEPTYEQIAAILRSPVASTSSSGPVIFSAPDQVPPRPAHLAWQPSNPPGLEMAAWPDPKVAGVWCAIRNTSQHDVSYCNYMIGASVRIVARQKGTLDWQSIPQLDRLRYYFGAGPSNEHFQTLGAGQEMPTSRNERWTAHLSGAKPTLFVNVQEFDWPEQWSGDVEVCVIQTIPSFRPGTDWDGILKSNTVTIDLRRLPQPMNEQQLRDFFPRAVPIPQDTARDENSPAKTM